MSNTNIDDQTLNNINTETFRNHILNLYHGNERSTRNPNRLPLSQLRNTLSSRYYNVPPLGGYQINEEHDYNLDYDDHNALIFLDITTRFASPITDKEIKSMRKNKIREIKCKKVKETINIECPICLEEIRLGEFEKTLECKHCFHKKCIDKWFKKDNDLCPMCRTKVIF